MIRADKLLRIGLCVSLAAFFSLAGINEAKGSAYTVSVSPETGAVSELSEALVYIPSAWARDSARLAERAGIGYTGKIEPYTRELTRAELAYAAVRLYEALSGETLSLTGAQKAKILSRFDDSEKNGKPFYEETFLAVEYGLMFGVSATEFSEDTLVTREQTAAVLFRIAERFTDMPPEAQADLSAFSDSGDISEYAYDCFSVMVGAGILSGVSEELLAPKRICTYEQVLAIAVRFLEALSETAGISSYLRELSEDSVAAPAVINAQKSEVLYQEKQTEILDAQWEPVSGAIGYAVDGVRSDGTISRSVTSETGITIFEADAFIDINVFPVFKEGNIGILGEAGASLVNVSAEAFANYNQNEYNDYSAALESEPETEFNMYEYGDGQSVNPKGIEIKAYASNEEALADMENITVRVWGIGADGSRVLKSMSFYVHYAVAQDVIDIFEEIFNGEEQFPIYAVEGYSWRGAGSKSSHNNGLAIDINPDHNYFIDTTGGILAGQMWDPANSPYSIKQDGDVVRAFNKRGWFWGGIGWSTTGKDFMHFSYTGI